MRRISRLSGQAAMEYMSIVGIALLLLAPIILAAERSVKDMNNDSGMMLAREALNKMANAAEVVHAQGPPSTMTVEIQFPPRMLRGIATGQMLLIEVPAGEKSSDVVSVLDFNVTGTLPPAGGVHKMRIEAMYDKVNITAVS